MNVHWFMKIENRQVNLWVILWRFKTFENQKIKINYEVDICYFWQKFHGIYKHNMAFHFLYQGLINFVN
jgi:hypothetical protein